MVETRIQREKGGEGSLNQAVKSFPAGKGEDKGQRKWSSLSSSLKWSCYDEEEEILEK